MVAYLAEWRFNKRINSKCTFPRITQIECTQIAQIHLYLSVLMHAIESFLKFVYLLAADNTLILYQLLE